MKYNKHTRRMFLQSSGGYLAIPFLTSLLPRQLWAATPPVTRRFISVLSGYGIGQNSTWIPGGEANPLNIPQPTQILAGLNGQGPTRYQRLRDFAPTNSSFLGKLYGSAASPYLEQMNILRSLDWSDRRGHDCSRVLGGINVADGELGTLSTIPTIDQVLNSNRNFNPAGLPLIFSGSSGNQSWSQALVNNEAVNGTMAGNDLLTLYNKMFNNGNFPEAGAMTLNHPRKDALSRIMEDYPRVRNSRNISGVDKITLDNALDKMSDVQRGLTQISTSSCSHKSLVKNADFYGASGNPATGKAMADMITAAIMCDTVRVFTLGLDISYGLGNFDGQDFDHGTTSHQPFAVVNGKPQWQRMAERQHAGLKNFIIPLVQALSGAIDPANGKSYLYNSLIMQGFEEGQAHNWGSQPVVLYGNAGGNLSSGNYIDYADRGRPNGGVFDGGDCQDGPPAVDQFGLMNPSVAGPGAARFTNNYRGVHYNRLLVTILQAMGLTPAEYEKESYNSQLLNRTDSFMGSQNYNLTSVGGYGRPFNWDLSRDTWGVKTFKADIANYNLKDFRYKLPMP